MGTYMRPTGILDLDSVTSGCQNSWRKAAFQCNISYGTFVKRQATTFQIVHQIKEYLKRKKWQLGSKYPSSYSTLKTSIVSRILTITDGVFVEG